MTATRERAINLRDWEVRAIQAGRLKMLVRPVKPQPISPGDGAYFDAYNGGPEWTWWTPDNRQYLSQIIRCPYGQPGDRLRGREAWQSVPFGPHRDWPGCPDLRPRKTCELNRARVVIWRADGEMPGPEIWRPSIHMPRWAVRNWLEITEVRCGRAQEMSEDEAVAAGFVSTVTMNEDHDDYYGSYASEQFARQYDADHGEGAWERDWVWMIGVKRIEVAS